MSGCMVWVKSVSVAVARRRKRDNKRNLRRTGTIFTTLHGQLMLKSTCIVMRKSKRSEIGKPCFIGTGVNATKATSQTRTRMNKPGMFLQFAPPSSYAFVPPPPQSPPAGPTPGDVSGDDAFARRVATSQGDAPPPAAEASPSQPSNSATISRAPVRYSKPHDDEDGTEDNVDDDAYSPPPALGSSLPEQPGDDAQARSSRPGQFGFAHRLMSKYGWTKGSGLGADESGIVNPLRVQVEKRRKKADADGGGWAEPGGKGKIVGGKRKEENTGKFGAMSDVIVLRNMLENMPNLEEEIAGGLGQEIGEECGEKYGRVERLYIDQESRRVFIKFTNQVSALRAVNELDGRVFNGNTIVPEFFDTEKFEQGKYH
ncbi:hypothetical protein FVEG_02810 [Fusarium verticillioides 7600]|uniref:G-patch domain-containing protein n=1 Tax=Gibberella moniliformis (strain M3125 / FGSC 7600) TaxID=334819 RepID=W7M6B1_GIBM7|nr:hypothetical protein FVEG_02810 [Fusarium verticillioides 7600]EWG40407.1 hypothetical protein FVEG_02810 [Fusarium verticillioides 7600]